MRSIILGLVLFAAAVIFMWLIYIYISNRSIRARQKSRAAIQPRVAKPRAPQQRIIKTITPTAGIMRQVLHVLPQGVPNPPELIFSKHPVAGIDVHMLQTKPQVRKIVEMYEKPRRQTRYLAFPWCVYTIVLFNSEFARFLINFSRTKILSENNVLIHPALPHIDSNDVVCYGERSDYQKVNNEISRIISLKGRLYQLIKTFWESTFSEHLSFVHFIPWGEIDMRLASFEIWEKQTIKNPTFILTTPWDFRPAGTVADIINRSWRR